MYYIFRFGPHKYDIRVIPTNFTKPPPPHGLTVYKGLKNVLIPRNFSQFVLSHPVAIEYYRWLEEVRVPDEIFFQTLSRVVEINQNQVVQDHEMNTTEVGIPRYTLWAFEKK